MVERSDLVPVLAGRSVPQLPAHGGSVLSLPSGDVAADLRRIGGTRRRATYELRIVNGSREQIAAYTYALPLPAGTRVWQGAVVPARSSLAVMVYVPDDRQSDTAALVAEIHAAGTRLTISAPPPKEKRSRKRVAGALAVALLAATGLAWGVVGGAKMLGGPRALAPRVTVRFIPLPATALRPHSQHPASPPLRVEVLHAPGSASSGQAVRIDYRTAGTVGTVALVDESGKNLARTQLDPSGSSVLMVPNVAVAQDLNIVVAARLGGARSSASAALFVRPAERTSALPPVHATPGPSAAHASVQNATDPYFVESDTLTGPIAVTPVQKVGRPIAVRVLTHPRALQVTLFASGGTPLSERDVPPSAHLVLFPALSRPRDLSLIATYKNGSGEESTISTLSVR